MKINDILNIVFALGVVGILVITTISKSLRAKKEQALAKPTGGKLPDAARQPSHTRKPGVEDILQEILGEKPLETKLNESHAAQKQRKAKMNQTEEPAARIDMEQEKDHPAISDRRYTPQFAALKSRFDVPEETTPEEKAEEELPRTGAQALRSMSRSELQQAIVLREVLGPPVSLQ